MEIWLDTADFELIETTSRLGVAYGVTTNPSILAGIHKTPKDVIAHLLAIQTGPVAVQVTADTAEAMLQQAKRLHSYNQRIVIKVPVTTIGLQVMSQMQAEKIPAMATAIFSANQVLLAGLAGAKYAAPYLSRMQQNGVDILVELENMLAIINHYALDLKIIAAAIQNINQITQCATLGVQAITLPPPALEELLQIHPLTRHSLDKFSQDWQSGHHPHDELFVVS